MLITQLNEDPLRRSPAQIVQTVQQGNLRKIRPEKNQILSVVANHSKIPKKFFLLHFNPVATVRVLSNWVERVTFFLD